jgi:branched-subunit amino acid aminotransferase/4-amino-4-deoxychorismate lyase
VILTGGVEAPDGSTPRPRLYAEVGPLPPWAAPSPSNAEPDRRTADVVIVSNILGGITPVHGLKTLNYLPNYLARREARKRGAHEAILRNAAGELLEGATSNVFLVIAETLVTPPTEGRALPGVTRGVVIEEARRLGIPGRETPVVEGDLSRASEAFLTSTIREILPIAAFDAVRLMAPGPLTQRLQEAYRGRVRAFLDGI